MPTVNGKPSAGVCTPPSAGSVQKSATRKSIDTRARLGYVAPIGSTDEDRVRHLTVALPPRHAARLFEAQEQGAGDDRLREIAAEALKETYVQDGGRRAGSLEEVHFTDIEHLEFDLQRPSWWSARRRKQ